jgi:hypothetical protein
MGVNMRKKDVVTKASQYQLPMSLTFSLTTLAKKAGSGIRPVPPPRFHRSIKKYPVLQQSPSLLHPKHNLTQSIQFIRLQIQDIAVRLDEMETTVHKIETMD